MGSVVLGSMVLGGYAGVTGDTSLVAEVVTWTGIVAVGGLTLLAAQIFLPAGAVATVLAGVGQPLLGYAVSGGVATLGGYAFGTAAKPVIGDLKSVIGDLK